MLAERDGDGFGAVAGADLLEDRIDDLLDAVLLQGQDVRDGLRVRDD